MANKILGRTLTATAAASAIVAGLGGHIDENGLKITFDAQACTTPGDRDCSPVDPEPPVEQPTTSNPTPDGANCEANPGHGRDLPRPHGVKGDIQWLIYKNGVDSTPDFTFTTTQPVVFTNDSWTAMTQGEHHRLVLQKNPLIEVGFLESPVRSGTGPNARLLDGDDLSIKIPRGQSQPISTIDREMVYAPEVFQMVPKVVVELCDLGMFKGAITGLYTPDMGDASKYIPQLGQSTQVASATYDASAQRLLTSKLVPTV